MKHLVIGAGRIGLPLAVSLAAKEPNAFVNVYDINDKLISSLAEGEDIPIFSDEEGLESTFKAVAFTNLFFHSNGLEGLLRESDNIWICLPTYSDVYGGANLFPIKQTLQYINDYWSRRGKVIFKSTLTTSDLKIIRRRIEDFAFSTDTPPWLYKVVIQPEFLKQGKALEGLNTPSRNVLGTFGCESPKELLNTDPSIPNYVMDANAACTTKLLANNLLAARLSVLNSHVLNLWKELVISNKETLSSAAFNIRQMLIAVGEDPRIGKLYLEPSVGFGGPCLPKDLDNQYYDFSGAEIPNALNALAVANEKTIEAWATSIYQAFGFADYTLVGEGFSDDSKDTRNSPAIIFKQHMDKYQDPKGKKILVILRKGIFPTLKKAEEAYPDHTIVDLTFSL